MSEENNESQETSSQEASSPAEQQPSESKTEVTKPERPDYIPEKFWDAESGQPKVKELANSYSHVEKKLGTSRDEIRAELEKEIQSKQAEGVPESYELIIPEDIVPEGAELNVNKEDPRFQALTKIAKENNWTQEQVNEIVKLDVLAQVESYNTTQQEMAKLGERAQQRVERIYSWATANFSPDTAKVIGSLARSADDVKALEEVIAKQTGKAFHVDEASGDGEVLTREKLRAMRADPKYMTDADYRAKVDAGYQMLFPGNSRVKQGKR